MPPDLRADRPLFEQIKAYIAEGILSGRFGADAQIPSVNQLTAHFGINPVTVLKGINQLTDEGLLYKKRGVGMFVSPEAHSLLRARYADSFDADFVRPLVQRAKSLGLTQEEVQRTMEKSWGEDDD
jgi:DNA-binding transcriptional regulator YhcF (GntR family)